MYKRRLKLATAILVLVMVLLSQSAVFAQNDAGSGKGYAVKVYAGEENLELSLEDLKSLPAEYQIEDEYIYNSKGGLKSAKVKGVSLAYLLKEKAGINAGVTELIFKASDGYPIDPQPLEDVLSEDLKYVLAYEIDGELIDNDGDPSNEEIVVYRKVKEEGEFGTVFKMVDTITIDDEKIVEEPVVEEPVVEEPKEEPEEKPVEEPTVSVEFTDITEEYEFAKTAITKLAELGIINGVGDNKYAPELEFTSDKFCKIMVEVLNYELVEYEGNFADVKAEDWFASYVGTAFKTGLFKGRSDNIFAPNEVITRQELATAVGRAAIQAELVGEEKMAKFIMDKTPFEDKASVAEWAAKEVAWLEAQGAFKGVADENFEPVKVVNRAEAAVIVYNTFFKE